jgi:multiple sugar transport system permease protein
LIDRRRPDRPRHRRSSLARRDARAGLAMIAPQVIGFLAFVIGPIIAVFWFALHRRNLLTGQSTFIAFANFETMFSSDAVFQKVLVNSLVFTAGLVPLNIALALTLALLLSRQLPGVVAFRTLFFAPVVTSAVAWAIVWRFMLQNESGTINQLLALVGVTGPNWLREEGWAMGSVIVTRVLKNVGLNMIIYLAAIQSIPTEYRDAARVDGAHGWQVLRYITLPLLAPTTLLISVITIVGSLQVFDHILLMTGGGPANATMVLVFYIYQQGVRQRGGRHALRRHAGAHARAVGPAGPGGVIRCGTAGSGTSPGTSCSWS